MRKNNGRTKEQNWGERRTKRADREREGRVRERTIASSGTNNDTLPTNQGRLGILILAVPIGCRARLYRLLPHPPMMSRWCPDEVDGVSMVSRWFSVRLHAKLADGWPPTGQHH
eukprot:6710632-Pyramimonas_sp.AAC.1